LPSILTLHSVTDEEGGYSSHIPGRAGPYPITRIRCCPGAFPSVASRPTPEGLVAHQSSICAQVNAWFPLPIGESFKPPVDNVSVPLHILFPYPNNTAATGSRPINCAPPGYPVIYVAHGQHGHNQAPGIGLRASFASLVEKSLRVSQKATSLSDAETPQQQHLSLTDYDAPAFQPSSSGRLPFPEVWWRSRTSMQVWGARVVRVSERQ
jgi:hypothetical protein